ncbi:aldo/keto reductase [Candidatus Poriferisocius sp.]|uniref:aldo/keto reductase n=1 Tax=Candidatus Poriferisocius sp. TaxID=3101276 RepID=UPI003B5A2CCB
MEYRTLGATGVQVSTLCLGAMMYGPIGNNDEAECAAMTHRALDAGINFIDTADRYSMGISEEFVGRALKGRRDEVVVATKFYGPMGDDPNMQGGSRRWVVRAVEDSLRRLDTDYIDLYQMHRPDPRTDFGDTLAALTDLVRDGKIRMIGTSTFPAELIVEGQWAAERRGLERVRCEQPPYSIFTREIERAVLPTCLAYGMGTIVWSPLNGGWLAGKYRKDAEWPKDSRAARNLLPAARWDRTNPVVQHKLDLVEELDALAAEVGCSMAGLAYAFTLAHPAVTSTIIGPRTPEQLEAALEHADLRLSSDVLDRIDELVPPGTDLNPDDAFYVSSAIAEATLRRR